MYSIEISGDGAVHYSGTRAVNIVGERTSRIAKADAARLVREFYSIGYFGLEDQYEIAFDAGIVSTSITVAGRSKKVRRIDWADPKLRGLVRLEQGIERVTDSKRWVSEGLPPKPGPDDPVEIIYDFDHCIEACNTYRIFVDRSRTGASVLLTVWYVGDKSNLMPEHRNGNISRDAVTKIVDDFYRIIGTTDDQAYSHRLYRWPNPGVIMNVHGVNLVVSDPDGVDRDIQALEEEIRDLAGVKTKIRRRPRDQAAQSGENG